MSNFLKSENGKLHSSIVTFEKEGKLLKFVLFGVVHVAASEYYKEVYKRLNDCDIVLYEGFGEAKRENRKKGNKPMYKASAEKLGLVSQDEGIDYRRLPAHWHRADLKREDAKIAFDQLLPHEKLLLKNIGILNAAAVGLFTLGFTQRRLFAEMIASVQNVPIYLPLFERLTKLIVGEREKVIFRKISLLDKSKTDKPKSVAIFYGAGHMSSISNYLNTLGYLETNREWIKTPLL